MRKIFEGKPTVLIHNGIVNREQLKKSRMNLNQLHAQKVADVRDVFLAEWLEGDGMLVQTFEQVNRKG